MNALPTLRQLQYLVAVVDLRHFGQAAERCFVTQSTLSAGLKDLEEALQATLVERTKRTVLPTPLGEAIATQARQLLAGAEALTATARASHAPLAGRMRLGVIPTIGPFVLPQVLGGLCEAYPEFTLHFREDRTRPLLDGLDAGDLEAALIALPFDVTGYRVMDLGADALWLAAPTDHRLMRARRATISPTDLTAEEALLLADGHCLRDHALAALSPCVAPGPDGFQASSLYTLVEMVAHGLGVTVVPEIALSAGLVRNNRVAVKPLAAACPARRLALVWRASYGREDDVAALGTYLKGRMAGLRVKRD